MAHIGTTLTSFLIAEQRKLEHARGSFTGLLADIAVACKKISALVNRGALVGVLGDSNSSNSQDEVQKKLDVLADELMREALGTNGHIAALASEEHPDVWYPPSHIPHGDYLVAYDPLDGSSNIENNLSIGTIFSVLRSPEVCRTASFLRPGTELVAAGYCIYGPSTVLTLTTGQGVNQFTLDPDIGEFLLTRRGVTIPAHTAEFAINMSRQRHWDPPVRRYIDECLQGKEGPRGKDFNMRWNASLVAEVHRILSRGGLFTYPLDAKLRAQGKNGRLRLLYELLPMALLVEQAGGAATTGTQRLLSVAPTMLHDRAPVFLGASEEVARIERYHLDPTSPA